MTSSEKPTVLVVDDRPQAGKLIQLQLRADYDVLLAFSYDEAIDVAQQRGVEAAVLDIQLGGKRTGVDLLHALRTMPHLEDLRAIACTAYAVPGSRTRFIDAGFDEYMGKPLTKNQLLGALSRLRDPSYQPQRTRFSVQPQRLNLPPSPAALTTLMELMHVEEEDDGEPDVPRLVELLQQEPLMLSVVLRHVNSPYYGLTKRVESIERAVTLLGFLPVCNLVLTELVTGVFAENIPESIRGIYQVVRQESIATALFARELSHHVDDVAADHAYTAGMLHQLGRLALLSEAPEEYPALWTFKEGKKAWHPPPLSDEVRHLQTDYARTGAALARSWKLPEEHMLATRYHRAPEWLRDASARPLCLTVHAAHYASAATLHVDSSTYTSDALQEAFTRLAEGTNATTDRLFRTLQQRTADVKQFVLA